jgi:hypothetical protein
MRAGAIDSTFAPKVGTDVCDVEIDGEVVVFCERTRRIHLLNATAGAVWRLFDGTVTLAELASEMASEFGEDRATVETSLVEVVQTAGAQGLLQGVEAEAPSDG